MKQDFNATHTFEVPLYEVPHHSFLEAMRLFSHSEAIPTATVQYWKENLTFMFVARNGKKISCSVKPISSNISQSRVPQIQQQISNFASKFNCSMSLVDKDADFRFSVVVSDPSSDDKVLYGRQVRSVIRVTIVVTSLPVEMALTNFFTVIDMSSRSMALKR